MGGEKRREKGSKEEGKEGRKKEARKGGERKGGKEEGEGKREGGWEEERKADCLGETHFPGLAPGSGFPGPC